MPDAERLDPSLLPRGKRDEEPEFDQFGDGEKVVEPLPKRLVGDLGIPEDGACVGKRGLLAGVELIRVVEAQQLVVFLFGESLPPSLDGALYPSVFARDGFGDIDSTEFLDAVIKDAVAKCQVPRL